MRLIHVNDACLPGIRREAGPEGFVYLRPDGTRVAEEEELARIRRLAVPPAYTDVWICPLPNGHLQATGRDARGRKQYRYHAEWSALRGADKFSRLEDFGQALPTIRRRVLRDLASYDGSTVTYEVALATLVRLLDTTYLRVGNEVYARENGSYGLTTLKNRHAGIAHQSIRLSFRGKHGVMHDLELDDRRIVRVIRRCKQLPGQELFQYEQDGVAHSIGSGDVNDYLSAVAGERFTAKDFRTWHGSVEALELTRLACLERTQSPRLASARTVVAEVARLLGNTVAVCRKSYIHPEILAVAQEAETDAAVHMLRRLSDAPDKRDGLRAAERRLLAFLAECGRRETVRPTGDR